MASFYSLGELILITPDLSSISIGFDTTDAFESRTITVAENKLTTTGANFGNIEENIYVNSSSDGCELLVKDGYKIKYVEYPKTVGNGGTLYKPGTTFNLVRDSTKTTYITIEVATSKVSIDLTTLTGWDNVTSGEHTLQVVAKATGYLDSKKSTAVSFTKASASTGETWVMNSQIETETEFNANISFKDANGNSYSNIIGARYTEQGEPPDGAYGISFDNSYVYNTSGSITGWHNEAYRTITFLEEPTGDLLTWLTANGTKQGGTTAHTLTWSDQYSYAIAITVNGNEITSPYTLQNGDVIKVPTLTKTTINGVSYSTFDESTLNISGEDITIARTGAEKTTSPVPYITINYTE